MNQSGETSNEKWETRCERLVGYIDIVGFRDFVSRNTHQQIYERLEILGDFKQKDNKYREKRIKAFVFSDSIIMFSKDNTEMGKRQLLISVRQLMSKLLKNGIPFKGAIAFGEITVDQEKSIFFGQSLIDAYVLSEELAFYGVLIHHSAEAAIKGVKHLDIRVLEMKAPLKNGAAFHLMLLPYLPYFTEKKDQLKITIEDYKKATSGSLRRYIDATEDALHTAHKYLQQMEDSKSVKKENAI